jgi:hypothetical protein
MNAEFDPSDLIRAVAIVVSANIRDRVDIQHERPSAPLHSWPKAVAGERSTRSRFAYSGLRATPRNCAASNTPMLPSKK